jgi:dihydroorotate dehydrogenase
MSWLYGRVVRPFLFCQEAEQVHNRTLRLLAWASRRETVCHTLAAFLAPPELPIELLGLRFPNPVGLAAGMDKHANALPAWASLGFGFSELGGVTWHPQPGNPPPRIFRAVSEAAIVNRMGFNNPGAAAVAEKLAQWRALERWPKHPVGINLGKSKITPLDQAAKDYADSFRLLQPHADFFVVNVSSPNTPNLRQLQDRAALDEILAAIQEVQQAALGASSQKPARPIFVKVAPDLSLTALDEILEVAEQRKIAGLVATNTTVSRPSANQPAVARVYAEQGGLSGRPLRERSTEIIRHLHRQSKGRLPIIGVGGIFTAADAWEKIIAGASLLQIYTGLVYEGPGIVKRIVAGLRQRLAERGFSQLQQAVGSGAK